MLSKNVENFDKIHLFSSEIQKIPEAVKRFFRENNSDNPCRYHYTGSSIEGYVSKVNSVINNVLKKIKDDREFIVQNKQEESVQIKEENKFLYNNDTNLPEYQNTKSKCISIKYFIFEYFIFSIYFIFEILTIYMANSNLKFAVCFTIYHINC